MYPHTTSTKDKSMNMYIISKGWFMPLCPFSLPTPLLSTPSPNNHWPSFCHYRLVVFYRFLYKWDNTICTFIVWRWIQHLSIFFVVSIVHFFLYHISISLHGRGGVHRYWWGWGEVQASLNNIQWSCIGRQSCYYLEGIKYLFYKAGEWWLIFNSVMSC